MSKLAGLCAFPLTPMVDDRVDEEAFAVIIQRLAAAGVDSITALGSTGSYPYLSAEERAKVVQIAVKHAGSIPVYAGIGALRTSQVLANADAAKAAGAVGLLLAPVSYQPLTEEDLFELFRTVTAHTTLPVVVYDNPGLSSFRYTIDFYARLAQLPQVVSIKIPPVPTEPAAAAAHVQSIRARIPAHVSIGVSGDEAAAAGLNAGCDVWYSVIGGTLPEPALALTRAAQQGKAAEAVALSGQLSPLWNVNKECGSSLRVIAAVAEQLGLATRSCLPLPLLGIDDDDRAKVAKALDAIGVKA